MCCARRRPKVSWYYCITVDRKCATIETKIAFCYTTVEASVELVPNQGSNVCIKTINGTASAGETLGLIEVPMGDYAKYFTDVVYNLFSETYIRLRFVLKVKPVPEKPIESQLQKDITSLLTNEQLADVTITVGQQKFHAQRAILSVRSAVFAAIFQSGMQESTLNQISIEDIQPEVFEQVLKFIYTDKVEGLEKIAHDLLAAADKYALDHLKNMCKDQLFRNITKETVLQTLALADLYRAQNLENKAIQFICANIKSMQTTDWKEFCNTNPNLAAKIFSKMTIN